MPEAIIVAEGEYDRTVRYSTKEEFEAFVDGVTCASGLYGAGSCLVLTTHDYYKLAQGDEDNKKLANLIKEHLL